MWLRTFQVFRSQYIGTPGDQDAARFFNNASAGASSVSPAPFDLSLLHNTLPVTPAHAQTPVQSASAMKPASAAWAADFMQQSPATEIQNPLTRSFLAQPQPMHTSQGYQEMVGVNQQGIFIRGNRAYFSSYAEQKQHP
jgi:hypothetical protein